MAVPRSVAVRVDAASAAGQPARERRRRDAWLSLVGLALVSFGPVLATAPGRVAADTKQYLYLDPTRFLASARWMWDPSVGLGEVTHQYIGYLFPMGPYYALVHVLGVPVPIAQRLWLGGILFAAGAGVVVLLRTFGQGGPGLAVGGLAYLATPYVLTYAGKTSGLLLPFAGLPYLVAFTVRAVRNGGFKDAAAFALVVLTVGTINATALIDVCIAPVLYLAYAAARREVPLRRVAATATKLGLLAAGVSAWWAAGLYDEARYGLDILRFTESVAAVTRTSLASEVLRGLGYWYFYGLDSVDHFVEPGVAYTQKLWLIAVSFAVPALAMALALALRWRPRGYFVLLVFAGTVVAVGAEPLTHPSPFGALVKVFELSTKEGFALRSLNRAVPLVALGWAGLLGAGTSALAETISQRAPKAALVRLSRRLAGPDRADRLARLAAAGAVVLAVAGLVAADLPSLWTASIIGDNLLRPAALPAFLPEAAEVLNHEALGTRVFVVPGTGFAYYDWGTTVDPVLPGLLTRPYVDREQVPQGSPATAALLDAIDNAIQQQTLPPQALAPLAALLSAGDVVVRSDLAYWREGTPRPRALWSMFDPIPPGLGSPQGFGSPSFLERHSPAELDASALSTPASVPEPPPLAAFPVRDPRPIVRLEPVAAPIVVDGGGSGIVEAAAVGLLSPGHAIVESPGLSSDPAAERAEADLPGAVLVVTDTNALRHRHWGSITDPEGYTLQPPRGPLVQRLTDTSLRVFPAAGPDARTIAELDGGIITVGASAYDGQPEDRPVNAFDGNLATSWSVGTATNPVGQDVFIELAHPVRTGSVRIVQRLVGAGHHFITRVTLRFDGSRPVTAELGPASRSPVGQVVRFAPRSFTRLSVRIDALNAPVPPSYLVHGVGFSEIDIPGVHVREVLRLPVDLLAVAGSASLGHPLVVLMSRQRVAPAGPRQDPEVELARRFLLPTSRTFSISGTATLSPAIGSDGVLSLLGVRGPADGGVSLRSSARLPGSPTAGALGAFFSHMPVPFTPPFGGQRGAFVEVTVQKPVRFDEVRLAIVADRRHSIPTELEISTGSGRRVVRLPRIRPSSRLGEAVPVTVRFPPLSGRRIRITVEAVRALRTVNDRTGERTTAPVALEDVVVPGVRMPKLPTRIPPVCRDDLLSIDGRPIGVEVSGTTADALEGRPLKLQACGAAAAGVLLGAGWHTVLTSPGATAGFSVDTLSFASAAGGGPLAVLPDGSLPPLPAAPHLPAVTVRATGPEGFVVHVGPLTKPSYLVLGESENQGWHAHVVGGGSLEGPQLIDGFANGFLLVPGRDGVPLGRPFTVKLSWAGQRVVSWAFAVSAGAVFGCLLAVFWPRRRRRLAPGFGEAGGASPARLGPVFGRDGRGPGLAGVCLAAVVAGGLGAAFVAPLVGVGFAAATALAARWRRLRVVFVIASVGSVLAIALIVLVGQALHGYPDLWGWPTEFPAVGELGLVAVVALVCDVMVGAFWERGGRR